MEGEVLPLTSCARPRWRVVPPLLLLALFAGLAVSSMRSKSVTGDEVAHLPSGYSYLVTGDFRLNMQHPPLIKGLAGMPLLVLDLKPVPGSPGWEKANEWDFGRDFLTNNQVSMSRILFLARLPMVAVGLAMGLILFFWAVQLWGYGPALLVLLLYCLSPNMLAHTRLVTTDMGVACFTVLVLYWLWLWVHTGKWCWAISCGLALGLALLAKYSGVVTAGLVLVLLGVAVVARRQQGLRLGPALAAAAAILALAAAVVLVGFGFPRGLANYGQGFGRIYADYNPYWEGFLWGEYSAQGFRSYYLLAQLWKTPLPTLLLFAVAMLRIDLKGSGLLRWAFILTPILVFHLAGVFNPANIGIRHVLPVFPFLFLACGAVAQSLFRSAVEGNRGRHRLWLRAARLGMAGLLVWYSASALMTFPHYIPYFNELAGGPDNGITYLDDSNIEWGQDLGSLGPFLADSASGQDSRSRILAFSPLQPADYGFVADPVGLSDAAWPSPGVTYLMGASFLQRSSLYQHCPGVRLHWLERYRPVDKLGWSIFVYRFTLDPKAADSEQVIYLPRDQWYQDAIDELSEIASRCPDFAAPREILGEVHRHRCAFRSSQGDLHGAAVDCVTAILMVPGDDRSRRLLAEIVNRADAPTPARGVGAALEHSRALAWVRQGLIADAVAALLRSLAQDPEYVPARFSLGSLMMTLGLPDQAASQWSECLRLAPENREAQESLDRLLALTSPDREDKGS